MNYPNRGSHQINTVKEEKHTIFANRGMDFEKAINSSNTYYDDQKRAIISKRPTPIHIVEVDYKNSCRITNAYFEKQSNADYNGVYRGKYIDFECKETKSKTSLTFNNIYSHQINHLEKVVFHGGIAFFLIYFITLNQVYLADAKEINNRYKEGRKKSISINELKEIGHLVEQGYIPRLNYLDVVDRVYFNEKNI